MNSHWSHDPIMHCKFSRIQYSSVLIPQSLFKLANHTIGNRSQLQAVLLCQGCGEVGTDDPYHWTRQIWGIWKLPPSYSPETPNLGQNVLSRVTLKFDGWPWKTIGHLSFAVSSFVQHFIAIGEFKLELQSGNAQFGSNLTIFRAVWPWNLTEDLEKQ